jgi:hypothetical protein
MRVDFASFQIIRETTDYEGEIIRVNVSYFNHKYLLLGYKGGKVEIRDTETLEKVYFETEICSDILQMQFVNGTTCGIFLLTKYHFHMIGLKRTNDGFEMDGKQF